MTDQPPLVGIIMGSDSDLPVMEQAARMLEKLRVPYELTVVSAHRTPDRLYEYARGAEDRGLRVLIAGAGGAAHLPGMTAALSAPGCPILLTCGRWRRLMPTAMANSPLARWPTPSSACAPSAVRNA